MANTLKSIVGKLNDTTRSGAGRRGRTVPGAHPLRRRDRTLPDEAAGYDRHAISPASCSSSASTNRGWPANWRAASTS